MATHRPKRLVWIGGIGAVVTAMCCFTPALVVLLGAMGAAAAIAYLDAVLLPLLALFVIIFVAGLIGVWRRGPDRT